MIICVFFSRFFDRPSVSRDRDCYGLTKISEILGGRQRFDHFEHGGPAQPAGTVLERVRHLKAGHRGGAIPHLESTCTRFNTSARRRTRPSAGPERSQQLQILPSLTLRQFFNGSAYFSSCANISVGANIFPCAKVLASAKDFGCANVFFIRQGFWMRQCFFYTFCGAYIFVYFVCILI